MTRWIRPAALPGIFALLLWAGCSNPNLAGGKLHFDQKRFDRAKETFQEAVDQMPKNGEARLWLGRSKAELGEPEAAAADFDQALQLEPRLAEDVKNTRDHYWSERFNSGLAYAQEGQEAITAGDKPAGQEKFRSALEEFKDAAVYSPERVQSYTNIGKMYFGLGVLDSALTMFNTVHTMAPEDQSMNEILVAVYSDEGNKAYQAGYEANTAGDSASARTHYETAEGLYRRALEVEPENLDVHYQSAGTAFELAQLNPARKAEYLETAATEYRTVVDANPEDQELFLNSLYDLTLVLRDLEKYTEASETANRLVDLHPREGSYWELRGRIEDKLGNKQALVAGLIFGRALKSGTPVEATQARSRAEGHGPGSDMRKRYLEGGQPEEILTFSDTSGLNYEAWFYWSRGVGYAFVEGSEKYETRFAPVVPGAAPQGGEESAPKTPEGEGN